MATITDKSAWMANPAHPGEILRGLYLAPMSVTIAEAAEALGVSRKHVSAIVNGRARVTPDMAVRLAAVFSTEPEVWVNLQTQYDRRDQGSVWLPKGPLSRSDQESAPTRGHCGLGEHLPAPGGGWRMHKNRSSKDRRAAQIEAHSIELPLRACLTAAFVSTTLHVVLS